ncbi:hypothetical protein F5146DRAFT_1060354 [Armillaria mellea]|nr:hypothetical protein F5146DRAFT_1060354 [Armillaria mellea]
MMSSSPSTFKPDRHSLGLHLHHIIMSPLITYPPHAHTHASSKAAVVTDQPAPVKGMVVEKKKEQEPMRLRGGCIPCPVSRTMFFVGR